ncbi:MAG: benzoyl-CoA reductase subunit A [Vicinamibacterales bacterium]|nr:benzoyl-CoA reductase subunit A [Vicinamibacterales bacterium]|tara:strand:- start:2521 stop:3870 length:1350 start_codon:yes stop_codon:yes gene_type:complete
MTGMDCWVGIDLGSTTTKAIILDSDGEILGRGITNSRSNYDVACAVARAEAFVDARFALARRALEGDAALAARAQELLPIIAASFAEAKHNAALVSLREELLIAARNDFYEGWQPALDRVLGEIVDAMEARAHELFVPGADRKSDFFRDLASSTFMQLSEEAADPSTMPQDVLIGMFDKAIIKVENKELEVSFEEHVSQALDRLLAAAGLEADERARAGELMERAVALPLDERGHVGTGYGRARLPFPKASIRSEILCHGLGAHATFPTTRTVLDIGGQDTKAIQVDGRGIVTGFQMNDRCAAGCGRYLGYIADEMNLGVHELGPMAMKSTRKVKINSTCTVFAGAELRDRLNLGQKREDILAGLHRAIMLRAMSLLARSGGVHDEFTFTGGVARNPAAVRALRELVTENYGERKINISAASIYTGALGAAIFARRAEDADESTEEAAA